MDHSANKTALITGASSGIGLELARLLAADGYRLILTARRGELLAKLAGELRLEHRTQVEVIALDLATPRGAEKLWRAVEQIGCGVDLLVNNAGVGDSGDFADASPANIERMIGLNIASLTLLTRYALPGMIENQCGKILNVASLAGLQPGGPGMSVYYASKTYVLAFSRAIGNELRGSGISVTALCPGPTRTEFETAANAQQTRLFAWMKPMQASSVARAGYRGLLRGSAIVVPGWSNKLLSLSWLLPARLTLAINRFLLSKPN